ncbi:2Fe-2S iron-sulfur cluster-binding protein [Atopomonas sediminilitoris]|uniref:2Fe-2S iron-sulfur cluster-binding protein n=1 Tax=Atopomonas sediminilitoris TaxID=2919919 RepID=UPI001F4D516C|nr:2Fe-2S iron-sulfur cluster-binding protein [Atopomonas sediminilitoris]MCJ8168689.1 2Fe-2S iron-sulfur cluster-binding protein [Atopomonas sediminilitoris]
MSTLEVGERVLTATDGELLLDVLLAQGVPVAHSCRAGSCHACLLQCQAGSVADPAPELLSAVQYQAGWRLACQCRVHGDARLALFDPQHDAIPAEVTALQWRGEVLCLQLHPARGVRYQAGQHIQLYVAGVARPYSFAAPPDGQGRLWLHINCAKPGAMSSALHSVTLGQTVHVGLVHGGALGYLPELADKPLWLISAGTGLAPLYAVLQAAHRAQHGAPIHLWQVSPAGECYWQTELDALAQQWSNFTWQSLARPDWPATLADMRLESRQVHALVCGSDNFIQAVSRRLFLAGLPRRQLHVEAFLTRSLSE